MSAKELDRLNVLHEVRKRHITQKQAGVEMGLSERWVRTLLKRLRREGDKALRHRLRGRASNRKTPEAVKRRVVELFRQKQQAKLWHDYGPTLAAEELAEDYGIQVNRETLRQWLWKPSCGERGEAASSESTCNRQRISKTMNPGEGPTIAGRRLRKRLSDFGISEELMDSEFTVVPTLSPANLFRSVRV